MNGSRRHIETIALAVVGLASVVPLRVNVESAWLFRTEMISVVTLTIVTLLFRRLRFARLIIPLVPILTAVVARSGHATPIAMEMTALTVLGCVAISMATLVRQPRIQSLSLVVGGFLTLFCASISDSRYAIVLPIVWMIGCVWHLIANHWERLDLAMPQTVTRNWTLKPSTILLTVSVLLVGGYVAAGRFTESSRLSGGFMPTSGGSKWSDPAARGGVGTGDAAIAAKDHAESFGAVDSDIFLETTESTLFDMFNDLIGEPKKRKVRWERRQGMGNENAVPTHEKAAKSEKGSGSFSTEREPPKRHLHLRDATGRSVIQWDGPTGIRLAMHRYDTFDGQQWTQTEDQSVSHLRRVDIGDAAWFFDPAKRRFLTSNPDSLNVGLLKVIKLKSNRLPVPMMATGVHIKEVDRTDFFSLAEDDSFQMPGRDQIPPLTVVHVASMLPSEDELREGLVPQTLEPSMAMDADESIDRIIREATAGQDNAYDRLFGCIRWLRENCRHDSAGTMASAGSESTGNRQGLSTSSAGVNRQPSNDKSALHRFLNSRRGGDYLFATSAALMARELGLRSRLVTGFYVRPDSYDWAAGHTSVSPADAHVWVEVQLADRRWFALEPTPGYVQPDYRASWWLRGKQFLAETWPTITVFGLLSLGTYFTRRVWVDWLFVFVWRLAVFLRPRQRLRLAIGIIERRAALAGHGRPTGVSQRAWLEGFTHHDAAIAAAADRFSDAADELFFGGGTQRSMDAATSVVNLLRVDAIRKLIQETTSRGRP